MVGAPGFEQFVIVLFNVMVRKADFILIDEPELSLHPALQMDFLTTLGAQARRGVLFSTHSVGLADAIAGRIYSLTKKDSYVEVKNFERTTDLAQLLGELSYLATNLAALIDSERTVAGAALEALA